MQPSDLINLAIAIFTAVAAIAALISARASRQAVEQANKAAEDGRKIAEKQTEALMTAAKANALASRINFYTEQMRPLLKIHEERGQSNRVLSPEGQTRLEKWGIEREHLACWLDQQANALGVGLNQECPGLEYNEIIRTRNKPAF